MNWKQWRDKVLEQGDAAREQFRAFWTGLAPRERLILSAAAGLCGLVILTFSVQQLGSFFLRSSFDLEDSLADARQIQDLVEELKSSRFQARRFDRLKEQRPENFQLEVFLEEQAKRFGVQIKGIQPKRLTSAAAADSTEKLFEVELQKGVSLDASLRFLESVEEALGLRLVELVMAPEFADASQLNVNFVIALKENL